MLGEGIVQVVEDAANPVWNEETMAFPQLGCKGMRVQSLKTGHLFLVGFPWHPARRKGGAQICSN